MVTIDLALRLFGGSCIGNVESNEVDYVLYRFSDSGAAVYLYIHLQHLWYWAMGRDGNRFLFPFSAIRDFNRDSDKPVRKKSKMSLNRFHLTKIFLASVIILVWIYILKTGNIVWIAFSSFLTGLFSFVIAIDEY
nr:hypothetical protein [Bacillus haikouensis]